MATTQRAPKVFELERFFAKYEFKAPHLLCCSDCEPLSVEHLLSLADPDSKQRWSSLKLSYTDSQGLPALRQEVCNLYTTVTPEDVVVCCPEEGVYLTMQALLEPGDHVVAMRPGYQSLYELAAAKGCRVTFWEPEVTDEAGVTFNISKLPELVEEGTKMVVVNFPHNPTGCLLTQEEWQALVACCSSKGAWLFSDEMYRHLELDPSHQLPAGVDLYPKALSLCGVSKSLGGPGLRLGWLACRDPRVVQQLLQLKDYTTICSSAPSEVLALMALRARERLWADNIALIRSNLQLADAFFQRHASLFSWHPPVAGPIAFPRLKNGEGVEAFCERVVQGCGVLLLPATVYAHEGSISGGHFRFAVGRRSFPEALEVFHRFLQQQA